MRLKPILEIFLGVLKSIDTDCEFRKEEFSVTHPSTYVALLALSTEINRQYRQEVAEEAQIIQKKR